MCCPWAKQWLGQAGHSGLSLLAAGPFPRVKRRPRPWGSHRPQLSAKQARVKIKELLDPGAGAWAVPLWRARFPRNGWVGRMPLWPPQGSKDTSRLMGFCCWGRDMAEAPGTAPEGPPGFPGPVAPVRPGGSETRGKAAWWPARAAWPCALGPLSASTASSMRPDALCEGHLHSESGPGHRAGGRRGRTGCALFPGSTAQESDPRLACRA